MNKQTQNLIKNLKSTQINVACMVHNYCCTFSIVSFLLHVPVAYNVFIICLIIHYGLILQIVFIVLTHFMKEFRGTSGHSSLLL